MAEGGAYLSQGQSQESLGDYDADPESVSQVSTPKPFHSQIQERKKQRKICLIYMRIKFA